ncbi:hypothetical protein [Streptococcus salivarius]|uniref:hypothetical protein n=1 Tax=Streptococcus salivarius TaxID=1304 RepID=UPI000E46762E|nr:hypothetical protein [Streptococcus salivarius]MBS7055242.1 hypothetical protein [Streptococcus salivarius]RGQ16156.1 hypothetical protein DWZ07_04215 [Streptococcus salivarius]
MSILKKLKQILNWWTFIFLGLGFLSVYVISSYTRQSIVCILSKPEVQAVLIVAFPTLVIWSGDITARRNEGFSSATETLLSLRKTFEDRILAVENSLKDYIDSGGENGKVGKAEFDKTVASLSGDLDYLYELLDSRDEGLFQNFYFLNVLSLLSKSEKIRSKGYEESSLSLKNVRDSKTKILRYYFLKMHANSNFELETTDEIFDYLGYSEDGEFTVRNIDFDYIPLSKNTTPLKEKTEIVFVDCKVNIKTIGYLLKSEGEERKVTFRNCDLIQYSLRNKKSSLPIEQLKKNLDVGTIIIS